MQPIWRSLTDPVFRSGLWCLLFFGLLGTLLLQQSRPTSVLSTDLTELLPVTEQDTGSAEASRAFVRNFNNSVVFLTASESRESSRSAARQLGLLLAESNRFETLLTEIDPDEWINLYKFYYPYRYILLNDADQALDPDQLANRMIDSTVSRLASPVGFANSQQLISDPLFQLPAWLESFAQGSGYLTHDEGLLTVEKHGLYHVLSYGLLHGESLSLGDQAELVEDIDAAISRVTDQYPDTEIIASGMVFHAKAGADSARSEVSTIGVGSVVGIILLILIAFRTLSPLFLALLSIGTGILAGYLVTSLLFGQVHVMTIVFGASLTGVSIDYAFHYMAEWLRQGKQWSPLAGLRHIMPGISLGLLTSLVGYFPMLSTPFPGLQQMAVFSSAGLIGAWMTVVLVYPAMLKQPNASNKQSSWPLPVVDKVLQFWARHLPEQNSRKLFAVLSLSAIPMIWLQTNDDIRLLQSRVPGLVAAENRIADITGNISDNRFYLVRGDSEEQMLQRTERLSQALAERVDQRQLQSYRSVSSMLPSQATQQQNYQGIAGIFATRLPELWQQMRFSGKAQEEAILSFKDAETHLLTPAQWLTSPVSTMYRHLWLGKHDGEHFSAVLLFQPAEDWNPAALESLDGVEFVDITGSTSELFGRYRVLMGWLLTIAYTAITALLALRYGINGAVRIVLPPLMSVLLTLSLLTIFGQSINLFHVLALIMVLGIGIDYTLFFREAGGEQRYTFMAITLSAMTTILSFGLLALSATAAIRGFGLTVLTGILLCYLLAPYAIRKKINETD